MSDELASIAGPSGTKAEGFSLAIISLEGRAKKYRKQRALPAVKDVDVIDGVLGIERDGKVRPCRFLQQLVYPDPDAPEREGVKAEDLRRFVQVLDHCVRHGRLAYGQLAPIVMMPLAHLDGPQRAMLVVYAFSDYSTDELNAWLGCKCFDEEGTIPNDQWPNIWRRWNDGGFRERVWHEVLEGAAVSDALIEEMAQAVLSIESCISAQFPGDALDMPHVGEAIEYAADVAHIARRAR